MRPVTITTSLTKSSLNSLRGRRTDYTYAANGLDLLEVRQTTGGMNDVLATYANYTASHQPQSVTDAAGQTTMLTYNGAGQVLTVMDLIRIGGQVD